MKQQLVDQNSTARGACQRPASARSAPYVSRDCNRRAVDPDFVRAAIHVFPGSRGAPAKPVSATDEHH